MSIGIEVVGALTLVLLGWALTSISGSLKEARIRADDMGHRLSILETQFKDHQAHVHGEIK
jgi:hypothetical protein